MEYIFVHRINSDEPITERIPLHMTALHWFETQQPNELTAAAQSALKDMRPITTTVTREDLFGPYHDIPVARLERTLELLELHLALLGVAQSSDARLDERWVGTSKWKPHVTHTKTGRLEPGDSVTIDPLDLICRQITTHSASF